MESVIKGIVSMCRMYVKKSKLKYWGVLKI
jgi:hypothetical protein